MTESIMYPSNMTDDQFAKLLEFQGEQAKQDRDVENERRLMEITHQTQQARSRNSMISMIVTIVMITSVFLTGIVAIARGVESSGERQDQLGRQCILSGGVWEDGEDEVGYRCRRP